MRSLWRAPRSGWAGCLGRAAAHTPLQWPHLAWEGGGGGDVLEEGEGGGEDVLEEGEGRGRDVLEEGGGLH